MLCPFGDILACGHFLFPKKHPAPWSHKIAIPLPPCGKIFFKKVFLM
jgi:hypothetical protein